MEAQGSQGLERDALGRVGPKERGAGPQHGFGASRPPPIPPPASRPRLEAEFAPGGPAEYLVQERGLVRGGRAGSAFPLCFSSHICGQSQGQGQGPRGDRPRSVCCSRPSCK